MHAEDGGDEALVSDMVPNSNSRAFDAPTIVERTIRWYSHASLSSEAMLPGRGGGVGASLSRSAGVRQLQWCISRE